MLCAHPLINKWKPYLANFLARNAGVQLECYDPYLFKILEATMHPRKNWPLFLTIVGMGISINQASDLMGMHKNSVFQYARRNQGFRKQLDEALEMQTACYAADPLYFVHPNTLEHVLDHNLEKILRKPPRGLAAWVHEQMSINPLRKLTL